MEELRLVNQAPGNEARRAEPHPASRSNSVGRAVAEIGWSLVLLVQLLGALSAVGAAERSRIRGGFA